MRRLVLLLILAAGCDDESIPAQVANAQLHGIVAAQAICGTGATVERTSSPFESVSIENYRAQRLIDGSCFVGGGIVSSPTLVSRSDEEAESCRARAGSWTIEISNGVVTVKQSANPLDVFEGSIETECTGFNLEAFGVE